MYFGKDVLGTINVSLIFLPVICVEVGAHFPGFSSTSPPWSPAPFWLHPTLGDKSQIGGQKLDVDDHSGGQLTSVVAHRFHDQS